LHKVIDYKRLVDTSCKRNAYLVFNDNGCLGNAGIKSGQVASAYVCLLKIS